MTTVEIVLYEESSIKKDAFQLSVELIRATLKKAGAIEELKRQIKEFGNEWHDIYQDNLGRDIATKLVLHGLNVEEFRKIPRFKDIQAVREIWHLVVEAAIL